MTIKVTYNVTDIYVSESVSATYINVSYEAPSGGGGAVWGDIIGTLSNQADLQAALDAKVPYSGAIANVDLGEFELKAGQLELDQTPTGTAGVAVTRWNASLGTIETTLSGGNVVLKHGRDMFERVVNKTGIQLTKAAYQAVRISDAQGQRLAVQLAQANNDANSADTIGLVVETIDNNQEGYIYTFGEIDGLNTTGSLQGETWIDGDVLYLSPTTAGRITNIKPVAPQHLVVIGYVVYAHNNNGKIYVKTMNGWELGELHDVNTTGATNGQVLKYNGTIWTPSGDVGITSLNGLTATTQTFSVDDRGTNVNIDSVGTNHKFNFPSASALNRGVLTSADWTTFNNKQNALTNPVTGTGVSGQVSYWSGTNTQTGSNNLFWDNTNARLGIGTAAPSDILDIRKNQVTTNVATTTSVLLSNTNSSGIAAYVFTSDGTTRQGGIQYNNTTGQRNLFSCTYTDIPYHFGTNNLIRFTVTGSTGNVLIGSTTDSGQRLQVIGDTLLSGITTITPSTLTGSGATSALSISQTWNTTGAPSLIYANVTNTASNSDSSLFRLDVSSSAVFSVSPTGLLKFGRPATAGSGIAAVDASNGNGQVNGLSLAFYMSGGTQNGYDFYFRNFSGTRTATSGTNGSLRTTVQFNPTSGNGTYDVISIGNTINQVGATGITRGLYVNPNLTAAADWRSIEWSNNTGWGLYGAGTAANYIGGTLSIGNTSTASAALRVFLNYDATRIWGVRNDGTISSGAVNSIYYTSSTRIAASVSTTSVTHFDSSEISIGAGATITNQFGFVANSSLTSATNNYGFYGNIAAGTGRWNLYCNGTADNYMAGSLGIGTVLGLADTTLRVAKNMTGGTTHTAIYNDGTIQTDVTTSGIYFRTQARTAASVAVTNVVHYYAQSLSLGAGSTVTNQFGYHAENNLIGATNNYGFYGNIAAGTGRWNLYMNGTANNYINGSLFIGSTTPLSTEKFGVYGTNAGGSVFMRIQNLGTTTGTNCAITFSTNTTNTFNASSTILSTALNTTGDTALAFQTSSAGTAGERARITSNGLLLGSTTDSGERLQVNGTMKVTGASTFGGNMTLSLNQVNPTILTISNTNVTNLAQAQLKLTTDGGTFWLAKRSSLMSVYKTLNVNDGYLYNDTAGNISILNDFATGNINFAAGGSSTAQWTIGSNGDLTAADGENIIVGSTNGTKIGTATSQKIGLWNATPIVQPTTAIAEATFVENSGGTAVNVDSTFAGYTLQQIAQALKNMGILA